jgi:replicative DNA helicase
MGRRLDDLEGVVIWDQREADELLVLAALLAFPAATAWERSGLDPALFVRPQTRAIAAAICAVRDSGQRFDRRRVARRLAGNRKAQTLVRDLYGAVGTEVGITAAMSRLHAVHHRTTTRRVP